MEICLTVKHEITQIKSYTSITVLILRSIIWLWEMQFRNPSHNLHTMVWKHSLIFLFFILFFCYSLVTCTLEKKRKNTHLVSAKNNMFNFTIWKVSKFKYVHKSLKSWGPNHLLIKVQENICDLVWHFFLSRF